MEKLKWKKSSEFSIFHFPFSIRRGFTLVEMIVALAIFSIVAVVALGALVKIVSANKKAQTLQASVTNLNFVLDTMSRELRVGSTYHCESGYVFNQTDLPSGQACDPGLSESSGGSSGAVIAFNSSKTDKTDPDNPCSLIFAYSFEPDPNGDGFILNKAQQSACDESLEFAPVVDTDNVTITGYFVEVTGAAYPRALVRISGFAGVREKEKTLFDVQTAVSARIP